MSSTNEYYQFSNKFNLGSTILLTLIGIFVAIILGVVYAIISHFSPLILIDIGLLVGMYSLIVVLQTHLSQIAKIRNVKINILMTFLICLFAYYSNLVTFEVLLFDTNYLSNWISLFLSPIDTITILINEIIPYREITITKGSSEGSISGLGLAGVYLVEFIGFLCPILAALSIEDAFCEDCQTWYKKYFFYSLSNEELENNINSSRVGSYADALANVELQKDIRDLLVQKTDDQMPMLNYEYCQCPKCQHKSILTITKKMLKQTKKGPEVEDVSDGILVNQAFIDNQTDQLFSTKI